MEKRKLTKDEVEQWRKEHRRVGYFNKQDSNLFVSKGYGIGFTLNWGNPLSWILIAVIIAIVIVIKISR
jgi:uncharacterized membrane protein